MKNIARLLVTVLIIFSGSVFASGSAENGSASLMVGLLLAFFAVIIVSQLLPGIVLFSTMLKGIFRGSPRKASLDDKPER